MSRPLKDSGIEWIGDIPEDWDIVRLKNIGVLYTGNSIKTENKDLYSDGEDAVPYIATKDIDADTGSIDYDNGMYVKNEDLDFRRAPKGSTLLCVEGGSAGKKIAFTEKEVAFVNKLCCIYSESSSSKYINYYIQSPAFFNEFSSNLSGLIGGVAIGLLRCHSITLPEENEQLNIISFLDKKVAFIDNILAKTRESIEEYKKYKQSLITETVTKGLNPKVKLKDSGVEWIEEIPEHWEILRTRYVGSLQNGISIGGESFGSGTPFVSYGDVYRNYQLPNDISGLVEASDNDKKNYSIQKGDIFFTRTSETIQEIGFSSVCMNDISDGTFAGFLIRLRPYQHIDINPLYSKYYFRSDMHRRFFVKEMNLVTRASLSQELLKKLPVLLPPYEEQSKIGEYLEMKCNEIDTQVYRKERLISELESYKKSLIYEVVTGKKEV